MMSVQKCIMYFNFLSWNISSKLKEKNMMKEEKKIMIPLK